MAAIEWMLKLALVAAWAAFTVLKRSDLGITDILLLLCALPISIGVVC